MTMIKIKENIEISNDLFLMKLDWPDLIKEINPGQFINIRISSENSYDPLLRRPFSIHDLDYDNKYISILYKVMGKGTKLLSKYGEGESLDIFGPLGRGFTTDINGKDILIMGGGMGIAPLYFLTRYLVPGNKVTILLGGNSKTELEYFINKFKELKVDIYTASIDGSIGYKGNVIDLCLKKMKLNYDYIYSCGPLPMLRKVQEITNEIHIKGEISLEEKMGCGLGLCLSCVCSTNKGQERVCKEGPVFNLEDPILSK